MVAVAFVSVSEIRETRDLRRQLSRDSASTVTSTAVQGAEVPTVVRKPSQEQLLQFEDSIEERDRLHSELTKLRAGIKIPAQPRPAETATPRAVPPQAVTWADAGRATPGATFESTLRTLVESDPDSLSNLIAFDDAAREEASRLYNLLPDDLQGDYTTPEALVAELMVANTKPRATELVVLEETFVGPNETSAKIGMSRDAKGNWRSATFRFRRDGGGWKIVVPALIIDGYRHRILGTTSLVEAE